MEPKLMRSDPEHLVAPVAKKVAKEMYHHGVTRVDHYHWLRDDDRADPEVLTHLAAENHYCDAMLAPTKDLQDSLYQEMRARVPDHQTSVPFQRRFYQYWHTFQDGAQYPQFWRAPLTAVMQHRLVVDTQSKDCQSSCLQKKIRCNCAFAVGLVG